MKEIQIPALSSDTISQSWHRSAALYQRPQASLQIAQWQACLVCESGRVMADCELSANRPYLGNPVPLSLVNRSHGSMAFPSMIFPNIIARSILSSNIIAISIRVVRSPFSLPPSGPKRSRNPCRSFHVLVISISLVLVHLVRFIILLSIHVVDVCSDVMRILDVDVDWRSASRVVATYSLLLTPLFLIRRREH